MILITSVNTKRLMNAEASSTFLFGDFILLTIIEGVVLCAYCLIIRPTLMLLTCPHVLAYGILIFLK